MRFFEYTRKSVEIADSQEFSIFIYLLNSLNLEEMISLFKDFLAAFDPNETYIFDERQFGELIESCTASFGSEFMEGLFKFIDQSLFYRYSQLDNLFTNHMKLDTHYGPFLKSAFFDLFKLPYPINYGGDKIGGGTDLWKTLPFLIILMFQNYYAKIEGRTHAFYVTLGISDDGKKLALNEGSIFSILSSFDTINRNYKVTSDKLEKVLILYRTMHSVLSKH